MAELKIVPASELEDGLEVTSSLMVEVALWLQDGGHPLWDPNTLKPTPLLAQYDLSELYVGYLGDVPAVAFVLQREDKLFWPDSLTGEAGYLHKLVVGRGFKGLGLADQVISYCKALCKQEGRRFLRLDCDANRNALTGLYTRNGLQQVDRRMVGDFDAALFECRV